jgi:phosphodiesterase/alkaline phosphatase D-like protein
MLREGFHHIRGNALMALSFIRRSFPVGLGLFLVGALGLPSLPPTQQERAAHAGVAQAGQEAAQSWYFLPYPARGQGWQTIVMLTNLGSRELRVNFAAYDEDGEFLGASTIRLAAQATRTLETGEVLPEGGTLKVEAKEHLWVGAIFRTRDGTKAEVLTALGNPSRQLDFPALLPGDLSGKTITLLNPDSASAHLEVVALDQGGAELDRTLLPPLSPMASQTFAVRDLFSGDILQQLSTVRVISDRGIVGLQLVDPPDGDLVGLPALTVTSRGWSFPIATQSEAGELWTAVGLFNPGEVATAVTVEAFDEANNSLGVIESLTLLPGATHFVLTANRQGGIPLNAAFLKVTSDQAIAGYEVIGVVNGNGLAAALGVRGDDQTVAGLEIAGSKDGSVLNAYPMVRMGDGGVKSTTGSLRSGEWREFIRTVPFGLEKTQVSQGTSFTLSFPLPNKRYDTATITTYFDHSARYDDSGNYRNYCPDGIMISYDGRGGSRQGPVIFELAYNNRDRTLTIFGRDFDNNAKVIFKPTTDPTPREPTITSRSPAKLTVQVPSDLNNGIYRVTVVSGSVSSNWVAFQKTSTGISPRNCFQNLYDYIQAGKLSEWSYGGIYYDAHPGYDFGTRYDDGRDTGIIDVLAAADGTVVEVIPSYGKITIEHQGGQYRTVYAHLSECFYKGSYYKISDRMCQRLKVERVQIQRGQVIGKSGNTGLSSGPHLHFEVRKSINGILVPIDPYGWQGTGTDPYRYSTTLLWDRSDLPTATTSPASSTSNSATLKATVNPNGSATRVYFQWGTSTSYGNSTPPQSIGSGTSTVNVSANLSGLLPNTTYYYRIVASNSAGTTYGSGMSFRTNAVGAAPTATTGSATNITTNSATLTGTVNPNGLATTVYFQWGTSPSYGNSTPSQSIGSGTSTVNVSANLSGLLPNTTYYYRIVASNSAGTTYGSGMSFRTNAVGAAPTATTGSATNITTNSATLTGTVNPNGLATTVYFQWGTSTSYGNSTPSQSIGSGTSTVNVSANLSGLLPNTTYYYRIVASNSAGTTYGSGMSFRTNAVGAAPTATTGSATNITTNSATLTGTVNPNGLATTVYFQWGTSTSYGNSTPSQSIGSGTSTVNVSANLSGLLPNTTYYYRIVASNSAGTTYGSGMSFRTNAVGAAPTATTGSATNITTNSATLTGTVNPNGLATTVYFQWGTSPSYGNSTPSQSIGSGTSTVNVSANLSGLLPNTTYYYRIVASNSAGTTYGSGMSFRTNAVGAAPTATTGSATNITTNSATLTGTVNPNGLATTVYFQWGTSPSYGNSTPSQSIGSGTSTVNVSANLSGLLPNTTYYYRIVASNSAGTTYGSGMSFRTNAVGAAPTATTGSATNITTNSATLTGTVNPNGLATTVYFQWGTSPSYGNSTPSQSIGSGTSTVNVSANLSGLLPNTTYYYRIVASNSAGTTYGSGMSFRTNAVGAAPTATTGSATNITTNSATLTGTVNPNGLATTVYFQWGTSTSYGNSTPSQSIGSGTSTVNVSANLSGLLPNTTYYYRIVASNSAGTTYGSGMSFRTNSLPPATNRLLNPSFESGPVYWVQDSSTGYNIITNLTAARARTGSWYAWFGSSNNISEYIYQDVTIPANATVANVEFWYQVATDETSTSTCYDKLVVEVRRPSDNALLRTLTMLCNYHKTNIWTRSGPFSVLDFRGQTIRLRFYCTTDGSLPTSFFVDDVALIADGN